MGAITGGNAIYLGISDGKISRRVVQPTTDSKQRTSKTGKIVNEEFYKGWQGKIVDISTKDNEFGKQWLITIQDEDGTAILQMPYSSGYSMAFLKCLPNVDLSRHVKIIPSLKMEGDKKKTTVFLEQGGTPIKWAFTKDNPNGLPELKQKKIKGKVVWDDSEILEFLEEMVKSDILPKIKKSAPVTADDIDEKDEAPF